MVTDNGSNVVKAVKNMGLQRTSCYAHSLNLIKACEPLHEMRQKVSKVVVTIRQATVMKEKYVHETLGEKPQRLIQDVDQMLETFLELKDAISLLITQTGLDREVGTFGTSFWEVLEQAVMLLQPFYDVTVELSAEKFPTAPQINPLKWWVTEGNKDFLSCSRWPSSTSRFRQPQSHWRGSSHLQDRSYQCAC